MRVDIMTNETLSSYEYGWEHGYRQAADGHPSNEPAKIPDEIVDAGSPEEYERGYQDGYYERNRSR